MNFSLASFSNIQNVIADSESLRFIRGKSLYYFFLFGKISKTKNFRAFIHTLSLVKAGYNTWKQSSAGMPARPYSRDPWILGDTWRGRGVSWSQGKPVKLSYRKAP
jgi:hypothetical protein